MTDNDRWLWDRTGPPDEDVERLERLLAPLGLGEGAAALGSPPRLVAWVPFGVAASLLVAGLVAWALARSEQPAGTAPAGKIAPGSALVADGRPVLAGAWIRAGDAPRQVVLGEMGSVTLDPGSRLQVTRVGADETRLFLERGSLEARISAAARPRFFQVDTKAARCVDLGCRYTLAVEEGGVARVRVVTGQVSFETEEREVFVPRGATCAASPGSGPGTPRFEDSPPALVEALDAFDAAVSAPGARRRELSARVLAEVKTPRDTLVAWHLLEDRDAEIARAAAGALEQRAGRPPGLSDAADRATVGDRALWKDHLAPFWR